MSDFKFKTTQTENGDPVYVAHLYHWEAAGFPDPVTGTPLDPDRLALDRCTDSNKRFKWYLAMSYMSGSLLRLYTDSSYANGYFME